MTTPNAASGTSDVCDRARRIERSSRVDRVRERSAAALAGETIAAREARHKVRSDAWTRWLRQKMDDAGSTDPAELLPELAAKIDQTIDDRVAGAVREFKQSLRKALTP
jgi:hypothetical protein